MCGRYTLTAAGELVDKYHFKQQEIKNNYNVAPRQQMPVITSNGEIEQIEVMQWGLIPFFSKDGVFSFSTFNARAEGIEAKPTFRGPFKRYRCLVPASGYYEWKTEGSKKTPYYFTLKNSELMTFAGLYDVWHEGQPDEIRSYTIITTEPNDVASKVHNRMPVILDTDQGKAWLAQDSDMASLQGLLRPISNESLLLREVGKDVGNVRNNYPELLNSL